MATSFAELLSHADEVLPVFIHLTGVNNHSKSRLQTSQITETTGPLL